MTQTPAPNPALRHFLVDTDLTPAEQSEVLDMAQAMKADRSQHFNLFQLIGNLFSELMKSFVSLFVISILAAGVIYILWLLFEEITA